jgi:succinate dehydrogenase / fumarate reductase iron-sulfur subunit
MSCAHGICGSDGLTINSQSALACQKLVKDYQGSEVELEPLPTFKVLKDLVVDLDPFFERVEWIRPYLIASNAPENERLQSEEERRKMGEAIRCILCKRWHLSISMRMKYLGPGPLEKLSARSSIRETGAEEKPKQLEYRQGLGMSQSLNAPGMPQGDTRHKN